VRDRPLRADAAPGEAAQRRRLRRGVVDPRLGSVDDLPAFDAPFDKMLAANAMLFWNQPDARLEELRRLLRPGGLIAIGHQPRGPGATDETSASKGLLLAAGHAAESLIECDPLGADCECGRKRQRVGQSHGAVPRRQTGGPTGKVAVDREDGGQERAHDVGVERYQIGKGSRGDWI
jgi:SAM-dependent methyltransferase